MPHSSISIQDNIDYYDAIAAGYDDMLNQNSLNRNIRLVVAKKFSEVVEQGPVLDFGGGTGLDIEWLKSYGYKVLFLEPSAKMRAIAIKNNPEFASDRVIFLDDNGCKIHTWAGSAPFAPVNGVLCNFAVLNNIPDLKEIFEKLSIAVRQQGSIVALVLKASFQKLFKISFRRGLKKLFTRQSFTITTQFGDKQQIVYLHTIGVIKKASSPHFRLKEIVPLEHSEFILIHLERI